MVIKKTENKYLSFISFHFACEKRVIKGLSDVGRLGLMFTHKFICQKYMPTPGYRLC